MEPRVCNAGERHGERAAEHSRCARQYAAWQATTPPRFCESPPTSRPPPKAFQHHPIFRLLASAGAPDLLPTELSSSVPRANLHPYQGFRNYRIDMAGILRLPAHSAVWDDRRCWDRIRAEYGVIPQSRRCVGSRGDGMPVAALGSARRFGPADATGCSGTADPGSFSGDLGNRRPAGCSESCGDRLVSAPGPGCCQLASDASIGR